MAAEPEHDVYQHYGGFTGVAFPFDGVYTPLRVDHRMRPVTRKLLLTEIEADVVGTAGFGQVPVSPERGVRKHRRCVLGEDGHGLVTESAARE